LIKIKKFIYYVIYYNSMEIIKIPQDLQKDYLVMFSNHAVVCNEQHLRVCPCFNLFI
jgi:hypothetical protein